MSKNLIHSLFTSYIGISQTLILTCRQQDILHKSYQEHHLAHFLFLFSYSLYPPEIFLLNVLHEFHSFYCVWFCVELAIAFCLSHTLCVILTITSPSLINRPLPHPLPLNVDHIVASVLIKFIFKHPPQKLPSILFNKIYFKMVLYMIHKMLEMNLCLSIPYLEYEACSGYYQIQHLSALTKDLSTCG